MQTAKSKSPQRADWKVLYVSALFNQEPGRIAERIAQAEAAIMERERDLRALKGDHIDEQQHLEDAMYTLGALRKTVEMNRSMRVASKEWEATGT